MRIAVDAGHGGRDPGASSNGVLEKHVALEVARAVAENLREAGHVPLMTRHGDRYHDLALRASHANRHRADRFVSIHCNAAGNPEAHGLETWCYNGSLRGRGLACEVQASLLLALRGVRDRGVKEANFAVLRLTTMPACLVELGFITNEAERARLADPTWRAKAARAIAQGVVAPLGGGL